MKTTTTPVMHDTDTCPCNDDVFGLGPCIECRAEFARRQGAQNVVEADASIEDEVEAFVEFAMLGAADDA